MAKQAARRVSVHHYTYDDYLAVEQQSTIRHEFVDGSILAMAGGSLRHGALASRISGALEAARKEGCVAFQSDVRVRVLATGRAAYPDASMVCGPVERDPADPQRATITNPVLLVEVLSPSTEADDRGGKWQDYQLLPSLVEYVLVSQSNPRIEIYRRTGPETWEYRDVTEGAIELATGPRLEVESLFAGLPE